MFDESFKTDGRDLYFYEFLTCSAKGFPCELIHCWKSKTQHGYFYNYSSLLFIITDFVYRCTNTNLKTCQYNPLHRKSYISFNLQQHILVFEVQGFLISQLIVCWQTYREQIGYVKNWAIF